MERFKRYLKPLVIMTYLLDDDEEIIDLFREIFEANGLDNCEYFSKGKVFMDNLNENVHICVVDHDLRNGVTGLEILEKVNQLNPDCKKIVVTGMEDNNLTIEYVNRCKIDQWIKKDFKSTYIQKLVDYIKGIIPEIKDRYQLMADAARWKAQIDEKQWNT